MNTKEVTMVTGAASGIGRATALMLAERGQLGAINFATSTNNTGLLMNYLRELSGAKEANRSHHRTAWCGKCEKVSRTYADQGPGNDGKLTNDCPTCNDNQVRVREREVINDLELLKEFGWDTFGSIPD